MFHKTQCYQTFEVCLVWWIQVLELQPLCHLYWKFETRRNQLVRNLLVQTRVWGEPTCYHLFNLISDISSMQPNKWRLKRLYFKSMWILILIEIFYFIHTFQKPILLHGHERSITQIKYNREGDLIFSCAKDSQPNVWYSLNGERLGSFRGHNGAVWNIDVNCILCYYKIIMIL